MRGTLAESCADRPPPYQMGRSRGGLDRVARIGFYSENQEDAHPGDPTVADSAQLRLPELDHVMRRLKRSSRHRAWMRRGYFETFYRPET